MKKRIMSIVLALVMLVSLVAGAIPALAAEDEGITIRLHYDRSEAEDPSYEGWEMWFWDYDSITTTLEPPYQFEEIDGEMIATIQVKTGTTKIGYIVRYGEWVAKDVDYDQFINITGILSGTVDFYVKAGVATQAVGGIEGIPDMEDLVEAGHMVLGSDVTQGVVVTEAKYKTANNKGNPELTVMVSSKLDYEADLSTFTVSNADGAVEITNIITLGTNYVMTLAEPLDLARGYNVTFEGREYAVTMPDYYSNAEFEDQFTYEGDDLGATYTKESTTLRVWAPTAINVSVNLYANGDPTVQPDPTEEVPMTQGDNGTWVVTLDGDMNGTYYTYKVYLDTTINEACDPYAKTTGVNGQRAMIIDMDSTNPEGWENDTNPHAGESYTDAVIYELHVRDLSADSSSGISNVGKYLGLIETGTKTSGGVSTGLDHMVDLGITHVHLLPVYDINSVDESKMDDDTVNHYNWGYDPLNYNVPEGSYSSDPYHGEVRVKEFKQMVQGLHNAGISVIMDVVYNHVADSGKFCMNKIVPGYFSRPNSNGSGCGNDTASERNMVSKYIVDSVNYWADEYHIDGFRFDLVGLLDTNTINNIVSSVHEKHPDVIFYGEGWDLGTNLTKTGLSLATMNNSTKTPDFAYFSDTMRNTIKGATYGGISAGFISGASISAGDLTALFKGMPSWCTTPTQSINYVSCHDNNTLYDHISIVKSSASLEEKAAMNKLAAAFYMTSQGIPFFQAGEEFMRSKPDDTKDTGYNENSYNAGDEVNSIKWADLEQDVYQNVYEYYKGLIAFRKAHAALRMTNASDVNSNVYAISGTDANVAAFEIRGGNGETSDGLVAIFNANSGASNVTLPAGNWDVYVNGEKAGTEVIETVSGTVSVPGVSAMVLVKGSGDATTNPGNSASDATQPTTNTGAEQPANSNTTLYIVLAIAAVVVVAVVVIILKKK